MPPCVHRHLSAEKSRVAHHSHAHGNVSDADAVVDESSRLSIGVPSLDIRSADLELQRGGHTITRLKTIGLRRLSVRMKIDEAGSDDEPGGVDGRAAREGAAEIATMVRPLMPRCLI